MLSHKNVCAQNADDVDVLVDAKWVANEKSYEKCELPGKNMARASGRFGMLLAIDAVGRNVHYISSQVALVCAKVDQDGLLPARPEQRTSYGGDTVATGPRCHVDAAEAARPGLHGQILGGVWLWCCNFRSSVDIGSCR